MWVKSLKAQMLQSFGGHSEHGQWSEERLQSWQTLQLMRAYTTAQMPAHRRQEQAASFMV